MSKRKLFPQYIVMLCIWAMFFSVFPFCAFAEEPPAAEPVAEVPAEAPAAPVPAPAPATESAPSDSAPADEAPFQAPVAEPAPEEAGGSEPAPVETGDFEPVAGETGDSEPAPVEAAAQPVTAEVAPEPAAEEADDVEPATEEADDAEPATEEADDAEPATEEADDAEPATEEADDAEPATEEADDAEPATEETDDTEEETSEAPKLKGTSVNSHTVILPDADTAAEEETESFRASGDGRPEDGKRPDDGSRPDGGGPRPGSGEIKDTIAAAPQITEHPAAEAYVLAGSDYDTPEYTCTAKLPEGKTEGTITFTWYVDGEAVSTSTKTAAEGEDVADTFTADVLKDLTEYGVHPVYCIVSMEITETDQDGNATTSTVSNQSMSANFIVCNGISNNSLLTFSDVHEVFSNIGKAISNVMTTVTQGLIPSLIVCTGDWKNSEHWMGGDETSENYLKTVNTLISRLLGQSGGIDTVFVSGNHENGAAARDENIKADLGADESYDGAGVIFDSKVANTGDRNGSSKELKDLVVYGINYENLKTDTGISYENILPGLEEYLEGLRGDYAGELIVISGHAGLHVVDNWGGKNEYNVDKSNEMVALLNKYSELGMNITYLFGHDHSKRESEMLLKSGDEITSTVSYALRDTDEASATQTQTLKFTYGHAGYLTNSIGGQQRYTVLSWTDLRQPDAVISRTLYELGREGNASAVEGLSADIAIVTAYHLTEPQNEYSWEGDESAGITVKADGDTETVFAGVAVDGKIIDAENYTAGKGAAVITLSPAYLKTLANGNHSLKLLFSNDTGINSDVETSFKITKKNEEKPEPAPEVTPTAAETAGSGTPVSQYYASRALIIDMTEVSVKTLLTDFLRSNRELYGIETVIIKVPNGSFVISMAELLALTGTSPAFTLKVSGDTVEIRVRGQLVATLTELIK